MPWEKVLFLPKNADFLQKTADITKIKRALVLKGIFLKLHMGMLLCTKFQVSSIILTSFRQRGNFTSSPPTHTHTHIPQNEHLKSPARLGLIPQSNFACQKRKRITATLDQESKSAEVHCYLKFFYASEDATQRKFLRLKKKYYWTLFKRRCEKQHLEKTPLSCIAW